MLQLVIDAMKLTPVNPSFVEAREGDRGRLRHQQLRQRTLDLGRVRGPRLRLSCRGAVGQVRARGPWGHEPARLERDAESDGQRDGDRRRPRQQQRRHRSGRADQAQRDAAQSASERRALQRGQRVRHADHVHARRDHRQRHDDLRRASGAGAVRLARRCRSGSIRRRSAASAIDFTLTVTCPLGTAPEDSPDPRRHCRGDRGARHLHEECESRP